MITVFNPDRKLNLALEVFDQFFASGSKGFPLILLFKFRTVRVNKCVVQLETVEIYPVISQTSITFSDMELLAYLVSTVHNDHSKTNHLSM